MSEHDLIWEALNQLVPAPIMSLVGNSLSGLDWRDPRERPTDSVICAKVEEIREALV